MRLGGAAVNWGVSAVMCYNPVSQPEGDAQAVMVAYKCVCPYVMDADGSRLANLTDDPDDDLGASANRSATVVIVPPCYFLGLDVLDGPGGLGASLPNCPNDLYKAGTVVNLTASPGEGWRVASWEDTDNDSSTSTSNTVTMDGNKSVCVRLEPIVPPTIPLPAEACALAATS